MSDALILPLPIQTKPKKTLTEIFNKFAADAVERFPHLKGQLIIADMTERHVYGHQQINTAKTGLTPDGVRQFLRDHETTKEMEKDAQASSCAMYIPKHKLSLIYINGMVSKDEVDDVSPEAEERLIFALDHELAHTALRKGFARAATTSTYAVHLAEAVADAYAMIRHYQRYGVDHDSRDRYVSPSARAGLFVLGSDTSHFTSFVLDAIVKRKHDIDFDNLSQEQTEELAERFAVQFMPPEQVVEDLWWEFKPVNDAFRKNPNDGVKALIDIALDPKSGYYAFKMASLWLGQYLEDRTFKNGAPIQLPKAYLDDVAAKMQVRDAKFAREDILFNMPIKPKQTPPTPIAA